MRPDFMKVLKERNDLVEKILKALRHLPHKQQMAIVLANFSTKTLKTFLLFQEGKK